MISIFVFEAVFLPTLIYALLRGGASERASILVLATAFTATPLLMAGAFQYLELRILAVSCTSFGLLLMIAFRSSKFWPLWLAAMQGLVVLSHVAPLLNKQVSPWTYYMSITIWSYLQLLLVAAATWEHRRFWVTKPVASG